MERLKAISERDAGAAAKALLDNATLTNALETIEEELFAKFKSPSISDEDALSVRHQAMAVDELRAKLRGTLNRGKYAEADLERRHGGR